MAWNLFSSQRSRSSLKYFAVASKETRLDSEVDTPWGAAARRVDLLRDAIPAFQVLAVGETLGETRRNQARIK